MFGNVKINYRRITYGNFIQRKSSSRYGSSKRYWLGIGTDVCRTGGGCGISIFAGKKWKPVLKN